MPQQFSFWPFDPDFGPTKRLSKRKHVTVLAALTRERWSLRRISMRVAGFADVRSDSGNVEPTLVTTVSRERSARPSARRLRGTREPGVIAGMANVGRNGLESHGGRASGLAKARVSSRSFQESKIAYVVIDARLLKNRRRVASFSRAERQRLSAMSQTV